MRSCAAGPGGRRLSNLAAVVRPMQQRLALASAAGEVAELAVALDLPHVTADRPPALDLSCVLVRHAAAQIVAAVPLEPATRIVLVQPSFATPFRQGLAGPDAEIVEL